MANGKGYRELEADVLDAKNLVCSARVELELATESVVAAHNGPVEGLQKSLFELDAAFRQLVHEERRLAVAEERCEVCRRRGLS
jgi:hypothetical protein